MENNRLISFEIERILMIVIIVCSRRVEILRVSKMSVFHWLHKISNCYLISGILASFFVYEYISRGWHDITNCVVRCGFLTMSTCSILENPRVIIIHHSSRWMSSTLHESAKIHMVPFFFTITICNSVHE